MKIKKFKFAIYGFIVAILTIVLFTYFITPLNLIEKLMFVVVGVGMGLFGDMIFLK